MEPTIQKDRREFIKGVGTSVLLLGAFASGIKSVKADITLDGSNDSITADILNIGEIKLEEAVPSDHSGIGFVITDTVGEDVAIGDVLYMHSTGKWKKVDADAVATMPVAVMAMAAISADADGKLLVFGFYRDDSWTWTVGGLLYASCTPGNPTQVAPSATGDQVQVVGVAITATIALFNPGYVLVEVA